MKKGFMLIEVVIVVSVIFTISIALYISTQNIMSKSNQIQKYDSTENLYSLNTIKVFLYQNYNVNSLCDFVLDPNTNGHKTFPLVNRTTSKDIYNIDFKDEEILKKFKSLMKEMNIKTLLFTNYSGILNGNDNTTNKIKEDLNLYDYINYLENNLDKTNQMIFLLIAEFKDGTFAAINMYRTSGDQIE